MDFDPPRPGEPSVDEEMASIKKVAVDKLRATFRA